VHTVADERDDRPALTLLEQLYGGRVGNVIDLSAATGWSQPAPEPDYLDTARRAFAAGDYWAALAAALISIAESVEPEPEWQPSPEDLERNRRWLAGNQR
jgi:hypothetical protein